MTTEETAEPDYTKYLDKAPTELQERFAIWVQEKTGFEANGCKTKQEAFEQGVRLGVALRMAFQASPENREAHAQRRAERAQAAAATPEADETAAPAAPRRGAKAAKSAVAPAPPAPAAPAKRAGRGARKATTAGAPF